MERRPDFRIETPEPVKITPLEKEGGWCGQFIATSDDEVKVQLNENLEVGSLLKLETRDIWMLAEAVRCQPSDEGFRADLTLLNWINKAELRSLSWEYEVVAPQPV
jgi:hypothetical protein